MRTDPFALPAEPCPRPPAPQWTASGRLPTSARRSSAGDRPTAASGASPGGRSALGVEPSADVRALRDRNRDEASQFLPSSVDGQVVTGVGTHQWVATSSRTHHPHQGHGMFCPPAASPRARRSHNKVRYALSSTSDMPSTSAGDSPNSRCSSPRSAGSCLGGAWPSRPPTPTLEPSLRRSGAFPSLTHAQNSAGVTLSWCLTIMDLRCGS